MTDLIDCLIEDIAAPVRNALVGGPFGSNLVSNDYVEDGVPIIRGQNMGLGRWVTGDFAYVSEEKAQSLSANIARPGDLLFTQRGTLGQVAIVPEDGYSEYVISQSQMKLTPDTTKADVLFLYYCFLSPEQRHYILSNAIQTGVPHTNLTILRNTPLILPPLNEQRAIAEILGSLDDKIEANRRMNETLEATARAIFKSWFVDFDPVHSKSRGEHPLGMDAARAALFPDSFEESELGPIPAGWGIGDLKDCCEKVENGGTPKRSEPSFWEPPTVPWLTSGEVRQQIIISTDGFISVSGLANSSAKLWDIGTIVIALYGATAGQVTLLAIPTTSNQACCGLTPLKDMTFFVYLHASNSVEELGMQARGSAQQNLSQSLVADFSTIIPSKEILTVFHNSVTPLFDKWINNLEESRTLAETRDALLPKLVSGEIRVGEVD